MQVGAAAVHPWRTSRRAPTALPSSAAAGRDWTEPGQQWKPAGSLPTLTLLGVGKTRIMEAVFANRDSSCTEACRKNSWSRKKHPACSLPRLRFFQNSDRCGHHPTRLSEYSPGGGLHASGGYQQEAGSSVLFEHCSADSALAVENVDELTWRIRTRCAKMHEVRVHGRSYLQDWRQCIDRAQAIMK